MSSSSAAGTPSGVPSGWQITDPLGLPGAPHDTLRALLQGLPGETAQPLPPHPRLLLVTDRQGERLRAGYAAVLVLGREVRVSAPAFGPRYGQAGAAALAELVRWAQAREVVLRETVLNASDFGRVLAEPDAAELERLLAASNPTDAGIYTAALPARTPDEQD